MTSRSLPSGHCHFDALAPSGPKSTNAPANEASVAFYSPVRKCKCAFMLLNVHNLFVSNCILTRSFVLPNWSNWDQL